METEVRKGRILFLITGLARGGAETQAVSLALRLQKLGWEVLIVSMTPPQAFVEELGAQGISVISLGIKKKLPNPWPMIRLVKLIRQWRPHIVHSHMVHANILARLLRIFAPIPVLICTAHNIDERGQKGSSDKFRLFLYRVTDPLCDLTTQVSRKGLERYVRLRAVPENKIRYIPNGVDTQIFSPNLGLRVQMRNELGLNQEFVWLAVGRFAPQKDYPTMLQAFAQVVKYFPNARLFIAGDGPLRPAMENMAKDLGIAHFVRFLGIRQDVPALMNAADALVMSSVYEGMPMVLLEAHSLALPIVATDVGDNGEIVPNGKTGFLVPPRNPPALAQAIIRLMNLSEEERQRMGLAGREHVVANFDINRIVAIWESLYIEFLCKKGVKVG